MRYSSEARRLEFWRMTGLSKKLHAKAAAEKQQSITLVNQSFDERKIVVLRSDASDKTAKQNESDDHFRLCRPSIRNVAVERCTSTLLSP